MKAIHKYRLPIADTLNLMLPVGAEVLTVQVQRGAPFVWALVDTDAPEEPRVFHVRGTGHPADALGRYVGTFQIDGGALVLGIIYLTPR